MGKESNEEGRGPFRPETARFWVILAILAVSTAAILIKISSSHPLTISFWRLFIAWLILLPFAIMDIKNSRFRFQRKQILQLALVGLFLALHFGTWIWSFEFTKVSSSVLLVTTHPVFVALISVYWLGERLKKVAIAGIVISLLGSGFVLGGDFAVSGDALLGDVLALAGSIAVGLYLLGGSRLRSSTTLPVYGVMVYGFAMIFLLIPILFLDVELIVDDSLEYLIFAALALGPMLAGHTVYNWSLKYISPTLVSVSLLGEPVGSTILAILILGDYPWIGFYLGAPLVFVGIYFVARYPPKRD